MYHLDDINQALKVYLFATFFCINFFEHRLDFYQLINSYTSTLNSVQPQMIKKNNLKFHWFPVQYNFSLDWQLKKKIL